MAQTTVDRVTERVRELASRTGDVTNQALGSVLPDRRARPRVASVMRGRTTRRRGLIIGMRAGKAAPPAILTAWQAGEFAGRLEGIAAAVPNMTRLWLDRSVAQMRGQAVAGGAKASMRTAPVGIAAVRALTQASTRRKSRTNAARTRQMMSAKVAAVAKQVAGIAAVSGGVATLSKRLSTVRDQINLPTGRTAIQQVRKTTRQTARQTTRQTAKGAQRARVARRGWALMPSSRTASSGPLVGTQRRLRRSWRWVRLFTLGFALGAVWAYLFAPRRQSTEARQETTGQQRRTTEQQPSAAEI